MPSSLASPTCHTSRIREKTDDHEAAGMLEIEHWERDQPLAAVPADGDQEVDRQSLIHRHGIL